MHPAEASRTAETTLAVRVVEGNRGREPGIEPDPVAGALLGDRIHVAGPLRGDPRIVCRLFRIGFPAMYAYLCARIAHLDRRTREALDAGVRQLVVLGAGYDTRGHRPWVRGAGVRVLEVDHPATQADKRSRIGSLGAEAPIAYVAVDLERDELGPALDAAGYDGGAPTLFLWEGVTPFVSEHAVRDTLGLVGRNRSPVSSLVFDDALPGAIAGTMRDREARMWRARVGRIGEPLRWGIDPADLPGVLDGCGLALRDDLAGRELAAAVGHASGVPPSSDLRIAHAGSRESVRA